MTIRMLGLMGLTPLNEFQRKSRAKTAQERWAYKNRHIIANLEKLNRDMEAQQKASDERFKKLFGYLPGDENDPNRKPTPELEPETDWDAIPNPHAEWRKANPPSEDEQDHPIFGRIPMNDKGNMVGYHEKEWRTPSGKVARRQPDGSIKYTAEQLRELELKYESSQAADKAQKMGLEYMQFGRWGKNGKVTHTTKGGQLQPVDVAGQNRRDMYGDGPDSPRSNPVKPVMSTPMDDPYGLNTPADPFNDPSHDAHLIATRDYDEDDYRHFGADENMNTNIPMFREMLNNTNRALGLTETPTLSRYELKSLIKEEYAKVQKELEKSSKKIRESLNDIREDCFADMMKRTRKEGANFQPALEKRLQINTVAEMIGVPVNELMLFFVNEVKHTNERQLIEYRLGFVYFYAN